MVREKFSLFYGEKENNKLEFRVFYILFHFAAESKRKEHRCMARGPEGKFQAELIKEIKNSFDDCLVMKLDSSYIQGIPDLLILHNDKWGALECKKSANAHRQPNQEYYVDLMDKMSFARFICPENKDEVLHELQQSL